MRITKLALRIARTATIGAILGAPGVAAAQIAVLSSTVEEKVASPGSRYTANIVISNPSSTEQSARIYQTDYRFAADGTSNFDEPGTTPRSNALWIAPQVSRVVVPARGRVTVPYSVSVPADAGLTGTYWSTVMVEGVTQEAAETGGSAAPTLALGSVMRYAIQVATHIDATGGRGVRFDDASAGLTESGTAMLDLDVTNAGERAYRPQLSVEVYDAEGKVRAKVKQQRGLLYPGTSLHQRFDLGSLPSGTYKAVVYADTGSEPVFATQYTITW